jgi:uncharacterized membrane protein
MKMYSLIIVLFILALSLAFGHSKESHRNNENPESFRSVPDTVSGVSDSTEYQHSKFEKTEQKAIVNTESIFDHLHNKVIHFPIALSITAFFLSILNFRYKKYDQTILILVVIAFVTSIVAITTGLNQASHFEGEAKEWIVEIHETIGFIIGGFLLLWAIALRLPATKKYHWIVGLVVVLLVSATGFLGGIISH